MKDTIIDLGDGTKVVIIPRDMWKISFLVALRLIPFVIIGALAVFGAIDVLEILLRLWRSSLH